MLFCIEPEAYEEERLAIENQASTPSRAPTEDETKSEPATTNTTEARQEGSAPANTNPTPEQQPVNTTLPEPKPACDTQREAASTLHPAETPLSPTLPPPPVPDSRNVPTPEGPPSDQNKQPHAPADILGILEED